MFTGIVEAMGRVEASGTPFDLTVPFASNELRIGQSLSIDGCCLTVTKITGEIVRFDLSPETLERTTLGRRRPGDTVNLERGLRLGDSLDGHFVTGHIDGVGTIRKLTRFGDGSVEMEIEVPTPTARWLAEKGSVALDGVSLTVNTVGNHSFRVMLIPHTLEVTTLGQKREGDPVNLEFDLLAKYVQRLARPADAT